MPEINDGGEDRRSNLALRRLIDELLTHVRAGEENAGWTPEERQRAEQDLERILSGLRNEAMRDRAK